MRRLAGFVFGIAIFLSMIFSSYCQAIEIEKLVDQFKESTDIQRQGINKEYKNQKISVAGTVKNVQDWQAFDQKADLGQRYYKVATNPQKTYAGAPYEVIIFYKDIDKVKNLNEGQNIQVEASLLDIIDERLLISVWVFGDQLAEEDRVMFKLKDG